MFDLKKIPRDFWLALLTVLILATLFPPWIFVYKSNVYTGGYSFLFFPPVPVPENLKKLAPQIDVARLSLEYLAVLLAFSLFYVFAFYSKTRPDNE